jgi:hypothetical protein
VRGRFAAAAEANIAGLLLATVCAALIPWCWLSIYRGRLWKVRNVDRAIMGLLIVLCSAAILQWSARMWM